MFTFEIGLMPNVYSDSDSDSDFGKSDSDFWIRIRILEKSDSDSQNRIRILENSDSDFSNRIRIRFKCRKPKDFAYLVFSFHLLCFSVHRFCQCHK